MRIAKLFLTFLLFAATSIGAAYAAGFDADFSADMVSQGSGQNIEGKLYVSHDKMRMEMPQAIMINRMDKNVAWILMPEQNVYMEHPIDRQMIERMSKEMPGELERKSLGKETVDDKSTEKFLVRYPVNGAETSIYQWLEEGGFPLKVAAADGSWSVEYRNFQKGPQRAELFEIPSGYQKLQMPDMSNIAAMAQGQDGPQEN